MATCKDCVHYDLCGTFTRPIMPDKANKSEELFKDFKNKADFVEIPCRCLDCICAEKHYDTTQLIGNTYYPSGVPTRLLYITCKYHKGKLAENDFCSYGERKSKNDFKE